MSYHNALCKPPSVIQKDGSVKIDGKTYLVHPGLGGYQVICVLFNMWGLPMLVVQKESFGPENEIQRTEADYDNEPDGWEKFHMTADGDT